eukprot:8104578-Alexandrium_andersonii.AAC.1
MGHAVELPLRSEHSSTAQDFTAPHCLPTEIGQNHWSKVGMGHVGKVSPDSHSKGRLVCQSELAPFCYEEILIERRCGGVPGLLSCVPEAPNR